MSKETMSSIYEAIADMSDHHLKVASSYEELEKILDERSMKMSKTIRVQWEYPDFAPHLGDKNYEDFEVDDDTSEKEIDKMAKEIALEHFD